MGIDPTTSHDALPIELSSPLEVGGGEEGIQVLVFLGKRSWNLHTSGTANDL